MLVSRARGKIRAGHFPEQTPTPLADRIETPNDVGQSDLLRRATQSKAASLSTQRNQQTVSCQLVQNLGEIVLRNRQLGGQLAGFQRAPVSMLGQVYGRSERVLGGLV